MYFPAPKGIVNKLINQHFAYIGILITLMLSAFCSVTEAVLELYFTPHNPAVLMTFSQGYFLFHNILLIFFVLYFLGITSHTKDKGKLFFGMFFIPHIINQVMTIVNPFMKWLFYINDDMEYTRGPLMWTLYATAGVYMLYGFTIFMINRKKIGKLDRTSTTILVFVGIIGILIQGIWSIAVELFFGSVSCLGFMLLLEERRVRDRGGRGSRIKGSFILVIALIFITVMSINISLVYTTSTSQTEEIGTVQLNIVKSDLQETLSEAESSLLKYSMSVEQLLNEDADMAELEKYIASQRDYYDEASDGICFSVYAANSDWTIIPGFDWPEDYHATERIWYVGAKEKDGEICITEPYIDADTGDLCFTLSVLLSDKDTVTAMDFTLSGVQNSVKRMRGEEEQMAMIVSEEGTIVGHSNALMLGEELYEVMPEYASVYERVKASNEHHSFKVRINGQERTIFSSETSNGWYLILSVNSSSLYKESYREMILIAAIDLLMVTVIIVFYMVSMKNQEKAENALAATESFIKGLSDKLRSPLDDIMRISDGTIREGVPGDEETMLEIRESGKKLSETLDNLFSYSKIIRSNPFEDEEQRRRKEKRMSLTSRYLRNAIIGILVGAMIIGMLLCVTSTAKWGSTRIGREADKYNNEVTGWMQRQNSILSMFVDMISADPDLMKDYDDAVKWLDDIGSNYSELSFVYLGNPYNKEHAIIMNNGWVPDPDYKVEERQWYIDTEKSNSGSSISAPYFDAQTGLYCITFSEVVNSKDGEFIGVFAIDCYIDKLIDILDDSYKDEGYAFLVDKDGVIINHPNEKYEMIEGEAVNIEDTVYADAYHSGEVESFFDYDGTYVTCVAEKSELSGFTVVVVRSWWSVYGSILLMLIIFVTLLIVCIAAVLYLMNRFIMWQQDANEKLVEAADAAVSAGKAKSRFLAQMSHEIRTPINAVLGMNEMILRESDDDSIREYAENIKLSGKNLLGLINSVLDFSKIEEGKMEIIPVKYETATMIGNLVNSIERRAEDKGLTFNVHVDEDIPFELYGDDMRISQVAINLLTNAVKYTKEGSVDLTITGEKIDDSTEKIGISVKDTGIGIKEEDFSKLFESFTRIEESRNRNIEGTGLGMAIVVKLLDMMGSKLEVRSEYGVGSEFSFEVIQEIVDDTPMGSYEERIKDIAIDKDDADYLYAPEAVILVVDDNEMNLKVINNLLKLNGIVPDTAGSGKEALEKIRSKEYHLVLLDHMMPEMDGIETLHKAKEEDLIKEGTYVVALTANAVVGARDTYLKEGFDDYLSKPVEVPALEHMLAKYIPDELLEYKKKNKKKEKKAKQKKTEVLEEVLEFAPADDKGQAGEGVESLKEKLGAHGVSYDEGVKFCGGDEDFYREVLFEYCETYDEKKPELEAALDNDDYDDYSIHIHALKSVSKTIGAKELFEMALSLEEASKAEDSEKVKSDHPVFMEKFASLVDVLRDILS